MEQNPLSRVKNKLYQLCLKITLLKCEPLLILDYVETLESCSI